MNIYKYYLKIAFKKKAMLILPIALFIMISFAYKMSAGTNRFSYGGEVATTIIAEDPDSEFVQGLEKFLDPYIKPIDTPEDKIDDALFYEDIEIAIFIAADNTITIKESVNSQYAFIPKYQTEQYQHAYDAYILIGDTPKTAIDKISKSETKPIPVELFNTIDNSNMGYEMVNLSLAYPLSMAILASVVAGLLTFQQKEIRNRNMISAVSSRKRNQSLFAGLFTVSAIMWILLTIISFLLAGQMLHWQYIIFNSGVFTLSIITMGFLFSKIIKTRSMQTLLLSGLPLVLSFISGMFVPQEFLGNTVLTIAKFFPFYWYGAGVEEIIDGTFNVIQTGSIQLAFAALYFLIALYLDRNNKEA